MEIIYAINRPRPRAIPARRCRRRRRCRIEHSTARKARTAAAGISPNGLNTDSCTAARQ